MTDNSQSGNNPPASPPAAIVPTFWGEARPYCPEITTAFSFAQTSAGDALTTTFDRLVADLQTPGGALTAASVAAFRAPLTSAPTERKLTGFVTTLRFFIAKTATARVALLLSLGGAARVIEFSCGDELNEDRIEEIAFSFPEGATPTLPALYSGSILVLVEREKDTDSVVAAVDSLDIIAQFA